VIHVVSFWDGRDIVVRGWAVSRGENVQA